MGSHHNIVLCAGQIDSATLPINTSTSKAMVTANGRPVIAWVLQDLLKKKIEQVTIVIRDGDDHLRNFAERRFGDRMDLTIVAAPPGSTILHSLVVGLQCQKEDGPVRIILGDTLTLDSFAGDDDFVYVAPVESSHRFCVVETDDEGLIREYADKVPTTDLSTTWELDEYQALVGYYSVRHGRALLEAARRCLRANKSELSAALFAYSKKHPIFARKVEDWIDFGHIEALAEAKRRLLQSRSFNSLTVNANLGTLRKISKHNLKLRDEIDWYRELPDSLRVLTPRLVSVKETNGEVELVQEYYGYPTLGELYVYGELHAEIWMSILARVLEITREFRKYPGTLSTAEYESVYVDKTYKRLDGFEPPSEEWAELFSAPEVECNGVRLLGWSTLRDDILERARQVARNANATVVHGDFCFSNILFDVNNQIVRLVDPRGRFGRKGVYGDPRYDIAKLRHSACGLYDYIVGDMFKVRRLGKHRYESVIYMTKIANQVARQFDSLVGEWAGDPQDIRFIEGLLFLSMLPLHNGQPERQKAMYFTGLRRMNEVLL